MKIVIIDDEKRVRASLLSAIKLHYPLAKVVGEAEDVSSGIKVIKDKKPDTVLLDIKMPGGNGFDLLKKLMPFKFKVIFITAFNEYAVQAFKFSAIDYLLKPVLAEELVAALKKAKTQLNFENKQFDVLLDNLDEKQRVKKIILNTQEATHVIEVKDIVRCEAERNYTRFFLLNERTILISGGLKEYEEMLQGFGFMRSHHSHLININHVKRMEKRNGGILIMKDDSEIPVSVRKYPEVSAALTRI